MKLYAQPRAWKVPGGLAPSLYRNALEQPHLMIGGATGSGKSVAVNGLIATLLATKAPCESKLILLDPKRVELVQYADVPHCLQYACTLSDMVYSLQHAVQIMEERFSDMASRRLKMYDGAHIYIVIDELADLMTTNKAAVMPLLQRLSQLGRAARIHTIIATQCPLACIIPTPIRVNYDARIALRCRSAQDSRNLLGVKGCETLPRFGSGYYMTPEGTELVKIPMIPQDEIDALLEHWTSSACRIA